MITVKLSYSILNTWKQKRYEEAVGQYLGKPFPATPQMELGKVMHELFEKETLETGQLPKILNLQYTLKDPQVEIKSELLVPLSDRYQILMRGIPDLYDNKTIYEYKVGKSAPGDTIDGWQLDMYNLFHKDAEKGIVICYNPYTKTTQVGVKYLGQHTIDNAIENIITYGSEMIDYLETQKLIVNYEKNN